MEMLQMHGLHSAGAGYTSTAHYSLQHPHGDPGPALPRPGGAGVLQGYLTPHSWGATGVPTHAWGGSTGFQHARGIPVQGYLAHKKTPHPSTLK